MELQWATSTGEDIIARKGHDVGVAVWVYQAANLGGSAGAAPPSDVKVLSRSNYRVRTAYGSVARYPGAHVKPREVAPELSCQQERINNQWAELMPSDWVSAATPLYPQSWHQHCWQRE